MSSTPQDDGGGNPYLVGVLVLVPMGAVVTAMAYFFTSVLLAFVVGAGFFGAAVALVGYAVLHRRETAEPGTG